MYHKGLYYYYCLFLIYINVIDLNISREILKYADDTKVICPIENEDYG